MTRVIVLLFCLVHMAVFSQTPSSWHVIKNKNFIFAMPQEPERYSKETDTDYGIMKSLHYDLKLNNCLFSFTLFEYPEEYIQSFSEKEILDHLISQISAGYQNPPNKKRIVYRDRPGCELYELVSRNNKWAYKYRIFYMKGEVYRLYVSEDQKLTYLSRLFLNSLDIINEGADK